MYLATSLISLTLILLAGTHASALAQSDSSEPSTNDTLPFATRPKTGFPGANLCGASTFEATTSDPLVSDCLTMVDNISNVDMSRGPYNAGKATWSVESFIKQQHQLVQFGTCAFGVQGGKKGEFNFQVGNADISDIVRTAVDRFGKGGKVGAKGVMSCVAQDGASVPGVMWGLYNNPKK